MRLRIVLGFALLLAGASLADARPKEWCPDASYDPEFPLAREVLLPPLTAELSSGDWRRANRTLAASYEAFLLERGLARRAVDGTLAIQFAGPDGERLAKFQQSLYGYLTVTATGPALFGNWEATYGPIMPELGYEMTSSDGAKDSPRVELFIPCDGFDTNDARRAMAYFADTMYNANYLGFDEAAQVTRDRIQSIYTGYRNLLDNGLPMWPQEWWINGLNVDLESEEPQEAPMWQTVFMRPSIAPAFKLDGIDDSELDAAIVLELIGTVHYRNEQRDKWIGGSLMATITNSNGIGVGGLLRYNQFIAGAAYHDNDSDVLLYVSFDLYDFLFGKEGASQKADEFLEGLGSRMMNEAFAPTP